MKENLAKAPQDSAITDGETVPMLASIIGKMQWTLFQSASASGFFWTSDSPIAMFNPINSGEIGNLGLLMKGIQVFFPLTPRLLLRMHDPKAYTFSTAVVARDEDLATANLLQVQSSTRFLFSESDSFDKAKEFLANHPNFRDPNRARSVTTKIEGPNSTIFHFKRV